MGSRSTESRRSADSLNSESTVGQPRDQLSRAADTGHPSLTSSQAEQQFGTEISSRRELNELQRLAKTHSRKQVRQWVDEGVPREAMGNPREMRAFRKSTEAAAPQETTHRTDPSIQRMTEDDDPAAYSDAETTTFPVAENDISAVDDTDDPAFFDAESTDESTFNSLRRSATENNIVANQREMGHGIVPQDLDSLIASIENSTQKPGQRDKYMPFSTSAPQINGGLGEITPIEPVPEQPSPTTGPHVADVDQETNETRVARVLAEGKGTVDSLGELQQKLRQGQDASLFVPGVYLPTVDRTPEQSLEAAQKYAKRLGLKTGTDEKSGQLVTRKDGKKTILKQSFPPEKKKEMSEKYKSEVAAHKENFARNEANKSTGLTKLFKNHVAQWHQTQKERHENKSTKYRTKEEAKQAADAEAARNAQAAREEADIIKHEAEITQNIHDHQEAQKAEQRANQAETEAERIPASMDGKVARAKQKVKELQEQLSEIDNSPVQITEQDLSRYKLKHASKSSSHKINFPPFIKKYRHDSDEKKEREYTQQYLDMKRNGKDNEAVLDDLKYNIATNREKRKAVVWKKLMAAQVDATHPYGPDQGSKLLRIVPTINNRERAFAGTEWEGTAGGQKFRSLFSEKADVHRQFIRMQAGRFALGGLLGA